MWIKEYKGFTLKKDGYDDVPWSVYHGTVRVGSALTPAQARKDIDHNRYFMISEGYLDEIRLH